MRNNLRDRIFCGNLVLVYAAKSGYSKSTPVLFVVDRIIEKEKKGFKPEQIYLFPELPFVKLFSLSFNKENQTLWVPAPQAYNRHDSYKEEFIIEIYREKEEILDHLSKQSTCLSCHREWISLLEKPYKFNFYRTGNSYP